MSDELFAQIEALSAGDRVVVEMFVPPVWFDRISALAVAPVPAAIAHPAGVPFHGRQIMPPDKAVLRWSDGSISVVDLAPESEPT